MEARNGFIRRTPQFIFSTYLIYDIYMKVFRVLICFMPVRFKKYISDNLSLILKNCFQLISHENVNSTLENIEG